jgi:hypothetical protein
VPIPIHARDVKPGLLLQIIREAGLTREQFLRLLRG